MIRINHRVLILLVLFMVLLDQVIGYAVRAQYTAGATYRLDVEERNTLSAYVDFIRQDQGRKVVFIGDSVMYGSSVRKGEDTIPAYVSEHAREKWPDEEIHFYNVGMRGLGIADAYYLLKSLHNPEQPIDLLVYNLNIGWFTEPKTINRDVILQMFPPEEVDWSALKVEPPAPLDENGWIREHVLRHWKLFYYRPTLNHWIFGQEATDWVKQQAEYTYRPETRVDDSSLYTPWYEKKWEDKLGEDWKLGTISYTNEQWQYFQSFLELAQEASDQTLIFFMPRNMELLNQFKKIDQPAMEETKQKLEQTITEEYSLHFVDYERRVESSKFTDTVHLLPEGNEQVAELLFEDIVRLQLLSP